MDQLGEDEYKQHSVEKLEDAVRQRCVAQVIDEVVKRVSE
jgi:hypothetical protein